MADIMRIKQSTMADIADETREIMGTTGKLSPAQMQEQLAAANAEIEKHTTLISKISDALATKAAGSGGNTYWVCGADLPETYIDTFTQKTYYIEVPDEIVSVIGLSSSISNTYNITVAHRQSSGSWAIDHAESNSTLGIVLSAVSGENNVLAVKNSDGDISSYYFILSDQKVPWATD